ncbi:hypothetical protein V502_08294 [Pseudogymnoascus sp. VKM F-4520 (FW-2644)]|nr:hypothetical protein V502_08294 [Pseudogymnoascus sp. VKM F-4520 (FW-2644)]
MKISKPMRLWSERIGPTIPGSAPGKPDQISISQSQIPDDISNTTTHASIPHHNPHHGKKSQVPHDRRAPNLHGHDGLLQDADAPACASPAEHAQIRSCCAQTGVVFGAEEEEVVGC